jgi:hypothetical protein
MFVIIKIFKFTLLYWPEKSITSLTHCLTILKSFIFYFNLKKVKLESKIFKSLRCIKVVL